MLARLAWFVGAGAVAIGVLRCAPSPGACVRVSDCASGLTCVEGSCVASAAPAADATTSGRTDGSSDSSAPAAEGGAPDDSGAASDAAAQAEAGPDPGDDADTDGGDELPPEE